MTAPITLSGPTRAPLEPWEAEAISTEPQLAETMSTARAAVPGQLWVREAERSERFDREGFDSFTEITAHAALAREAVERSKSQPE